MSSRASAGVESVAARPRRRERTTSNRRTRAVLGALLPGLEDAEPPLPGVLDTDFDGFARSFLPTAHPLLRLGFRAGCLAAVWVAPVLVRRLPPITRLSAADRERALDALSRTRVHSLRRLSGALRLVVALGYAGDERVRTAIGFPAAGRGEAGDGSRGPGPTAPGEAGA